MAPPTGQEMWLSIYISLFQQIYKQMNHEWIYCTTLICQQRIENSIVNKTYERKAVSENLKATNIIQ